MKTGRTKPPAGKKQGAAKRKRQSLAGLMPLEPRVMYDAAGAHTAASHMVLDPHHNDTTNAASATDPTHAASATDPTHAASAAISPQPVAPSNNLVQPCSLSADTVQVSGTNFTYAGGALPTVIDPNISVDSQETNLVTEAFAQITNGQDVNDTLAFNNGSNAVTTGGSTVNLEHFTDGHTITANGAQGGSGIGASLTLTGLASTADYSQALSQVTFSSGGNPTGASGTDTHRTITFQAINQVGIAGGQGSDGLHTTVGSPPPPPGAVTVAAGGLVTFTENRSGTVLLDTGITVSDGSGNNIRAILAAKVTLSGTAISLDSLASNGGNDTQTFSATGDTIAATSQSFNAATGVYTLNITGTGTAAEYTTVLQDIDYGTNAAGDPTGGGAATQRTVTWAVSTDGTTFGTPGTSTLDVVHTASVAVGSVQNYLEGQGPVLIEPSAFFGDSDAITSATVALPGNEFLTAAPSADQIGFLSGTSLSNTFTFGAGQTIRGVTGHGTTFTIASTSNGVFQITSTSTGTEAASNIDFEIAAGEVAYPGTTGADFIDYVIADEIVLPFDQQTEIAHLDGRRSMRENA